MSLTLPHSEFGRIFEGILCVKYETKRLVHVETESDGAEHGDLIIQ